MAPRAVQAQTDAILRAARAGLVESPEVAPVVETYQALGAKDGLRRARAGLEANFPRPLDAAEQRIFEGVVDALDYGLSAWAAIQRWLTKRGIIPPMTREEFNRIVERIGLKDPPPRSGTKGVLLNYGAALPMVVIEVDRRREGELSGFAKQVSDIRACTGSQRPRASQ